MHSCTQFLYIIFIYIFPHRKHTCTCYSIQAIFVCCHIAAHIFIYLRFCVVYIVHVQWHSNITNPYMCSCNKDSPLELCYMYRRSDFHCSKATYCLACTHVNVQCRSELSELCRCVLDATKMHMRIFLDSSSACFFFFFHCYSSLCV